MKKLIASIVMLAGIASAATVRIDVVTTVGDTTSTNTIDYSEARTDRVRAAVGNNVALFIRRAIKAAVIDYERAVRERQFEDAQRALIEQLNQDLGRLEDL